MIKYNGALLICLMMASNAFAMEVRQDLQGKSYKELEALERQNEQQLASFDAKYPNCEWLSDKDLEKERCAISDAGRALRTAMMWSGSAPRDQIKAHGISDAVPVVDMGDLSDDSQDHNNKDTK